MTQDSIEMLARLFGLPGDPLAEMMEDVRRLGGRGFVVIDPAEPPDGKRFLAAVVKDHIENTTAEGAALLAVMVEHKSPNVSDTTSNAIANLSQAIRAPEPEAPCPQCAGPIIIASAVPAPGATASCPHCCTFITTKDGKLQIETDAEAGARLVADHRRKAERNAN